LYFVIVLCILHCDGHLLKFFLFFLMQSFSTIYLEGGLPFPFFNLRTLEVHNGLRKSEIPGIVCLLKNAPLLDTLKLEFVHCDECMLTRRSDDVSIKHNLILLSFILV